jgi:hypothetical protein
MFYNILVLFLMVASFLAGLIVGFNKPVSKPEPYEPYDPLS